MYCRESVLLSRKTLLIGAWPPVDTLSIVRVGSLLTLSHELWRSFTLSNEPYIVREYTPQSMLCINWSMISCGYIINCQRMFSTDLLHYLWRSSTSSSELILWENILLRAKSMCFFTFLKLILLCTSQSSLLIKALQIIVFNHFNCTFLTFHPSIVFVLLSVLPLIVAFCLLITYLF